MAAQGYIGRAPGESSVIVARQTFTPTGITTNFTFASGYTVGYVDAYLNGARLIEGDDYTATDGSVVGLTTHAQNGDVLELVVYKAFNVSNVVAANDDFSVGGDLSVTGTSALTGNATVGSAITMYASAGIVSATQFFADGVLINPGAGGTWANYDSNAGVSTTKKVKIENNLEVTGAASTFSGNLTVGGVLTYDDVTNVDAVGYATFRSGVNVQGAGSTTTTLNVTGFSTFSDNVSIGDSIFHTGDIDTSIRFPAANTFTVETAGTESLRVNPRGQLLVGITTNTGTVDAAAVFGSERSSHDYAKIYFVSNTSNPSDDTALGFIGFSQDTLTNVANAFVAVRADGDHASDDYPTRFEFWTTNDGAAVASEKLRITSAGLVGIGTDSPLDLLHITSASGDARVVIQGTVNNDSELKFYEGGTNKFTIGHDAATGEFRIGSVNVDTSVKLKINAAGDATFSGVATATQFDATSDIALKENIEIIDEPITKLSELKGVTFDWKKGGHSVGVIAQDVEKVLPTAVGGSKDQKTVNYNAIIGLLVESVKDQQKQIEELKSLLDK